MAAVTIRNLTDETHRAIKQRAAKHGRSIESEICAILNEAVRLPNSEGIGSVLAKYGKNHDGIELNLSRDKNLKEVRGF
jgi:plasmid stability protein